MYTGFWWGNLRERDHLAGPGVMGGYIKIDLQALRYEVMVWIDVAQDRERWRSLVSVVMNLRVPQIAVNFLTS